MCVCVCEPELGFISAELHVGSEGAEVKSGLSYSQWSLFVVDGLLESHNVPLLDPNVLQDLHTQYHTTSIINQSIKESVNYTVCLSVCLSVYLCELHLQLGLGLYQLRAALAEGSVHTGALDSQILGDVLQDLLNQHSDTHTHTHTKFKFSVNLK